MLIAQFFENYVIRNRKELRNVYSKIDITKGNLVNIIGENGYVSFRKFKQFFRITPTDVTIGLYDYVSNMNNPIDKFQDLFAFNFILNFSKLDGPLTHVGNLYVNLNKITFHPSIETIELNFRFTKPNDKTLSQFNGVELFKSVIDAAYKSNFKINRKAFDRKKAHRLGQIEVGIPSIPPFDHIYKVFKITITDDTGKEYILNFKTDISVHYKRFHKNSNKVDLITVKDFISLTYPEHCALLSSYEEHQKWSCIETLDNIDTEIDDIFKDFRLFHLEQVVPLIEEEDENDED